MLCGRLHQMQIVILHDLNPQQQCSMVPTQNLNPQQNLLSQQQKPTTKPSEPTTKPSEPTTKPVEPTKPNPQDCWAFSDLCSCTLSEYCGLCLFTWKENNKTYSDKKCMSKGLNSNGLSGEAYCKQELGTWKVGIQQECKPGEYHEAEVKGTVTGTVDTTIKTAIETVIQKIISEKLGIDATKVTVNADITTNADGTSSFKVTVKIGNTEVSSDQFSDISKISTSDLESQLAANGVTTLSGTVNIQNNSNFAGKLIVSLLIVAVMMLF